MKKVLVQMLTLSVVVTLALTAYSQPADKDKVKKDGPDVKKGAMFMFEIGKVMSPFLRQLLELNKDQEKQIADIEKDATEKVMKLLTEEQKKKYQIIQEKGPMGLMKDSPFKDSPFKDKFKDKFKDAFKDKAKDGVKPPTDGVSTGINEWRAELRETRVPQISALNSLHGHDRRA